MAKTTSCPLVTLPVLIEAVAAEVFEFVAKRGEATEPLYPATAQDENPPDAPPAGVNVILLETLGAWQYHRLVQTDET